jgi:hypothetical protein
MSLALKYTEYGELRRLLQAGASDKVICDTFQCLLVSMNCEGAAKGYLAAAGFICHQRPHLVAWLLRRPIDALLQLGAENVAAVTWFVEHLVSEPEPYFAEWAGPDGIKWLREDFPKLADSLGPLFQECWQDLSEALGRAGGDHDGASS